MKEDYLDEIKNYNIRDARPIAKRMALLVIDVQRYFRVMVEPIVMDVVSLIEACRARGVKIFFTRHGHRDPAADGGMLGRWWGDLIQYGSAEWELVDELGVSQNETIIDKNRYSAFFDTDLDEQLRDLGVKDLVICGVLTNCCCETTARDAFVRDYRVFFVADATAATNEELHLASLKNLAFGFTHVVSAAQICLHLSENAKRNRE